MIRRLVAELAAWGVAFGGWVVCLALSCALARGQEAKGYARLASVDGGPTHADSVRVVGQAAAVLAAAYTPHREGAWCVARWHVAITARGDTLPVVDSVTFAAWGDSLSVVPPACLALHTHPPAFPRPSWADIGEAVMRRGYPFVVVQSGPHAFAGWVRHDLPPPTEVLP